MRVVATPLSGVIIIEPDVYEDERGYFLESYQERRYREQAGIDATFVQDNHSRSKAGVLRGLHLQVRHPQGKLIRAVTGRIWDVVVDIDPASATFRQWYGAELSAQNHHQLYVPPGFAHGFVVLSDYADVTYKCTEYYAPNDEVGLLWNDPDIAIDWPVEQPVLSDRDRQNLTLSRYLGGTSG